MKPLEYEEIAPEDIAKKLTEIKNEALKTCPVLREKVKQLSKEIASEIPARIYRLFDP